MNSAGGGAFSTRVYFHGDGHNRLITTKGEKLCCDLRSARARWKPAPNISIKKQEHGNPRSCNFVPFQTIHAKKITARADPSDFMGKPI
jgi:hypothetical protein